MAMWLQIIVNAAVAASLYLLVGFSFAVVYSLTRFFHFTHGAMIALGAYLVFSCRHFLQLPMPLAIMVSLIGTACAGGGIYLATYRPLMLRRASPLVLMLCSLGIYVVIQNLLSVCFGDFPLQIRATNVQEGVGFLGARITSVQVTILTVMASVLSLAGLAVRRTRFGRALRAVADDPELSSIAGVSTDRVILGAVAACAAVAGGAGILIAFEMDMIPTMGMNALMMGIIVAIIGSIQRISRLVAGAITLACAQQAVVVFLGAKWQDAVAFIILILFLLARPSLAFGKTKHG